jgi:hypothetical protein
MIATMPRDGAIIFSDLIGKLDVLRVTCEKCGRDGRYRLCRLLDERGREAACPIGSTKLLAIVQSDQA